MRPLGIVVAAPTFNLVPRVEKIAKPTYLQTLFAQASVKAFHIRVLHRLARSDVNQFNPPVQTPGDEAPAGEFRAVVGADALRRRSTLGDDLLQHADHAHAAKRSVRLQPRHSRV